MTGAFRAAIRAPLGPLMALSLLLSLPAAGAWAEIDPMQALADHKTTTSRHLDPMSALRSRSGATTEGPAPDPELGGLPDAPGAEETFYQCVACHSTEIIKQQHVTDARWDDLWHWMIEEQGMIPPDDETRDQILSYLKTHFSSER
ncbi:cytochrome C-552 [Paracoccus jeotgali]|uniref:cytochrome C-552 n=1 Tax=Paracoccus jeotgali TaxID=2065379 RepID=UPI0018647006|nr:cytochrome C-552 [Paracoccus jeotgali]